VNPPNISAFKTAAVAVLASVIWLTAPVTSAAAYEFDVHFTITIWLAEMVGFASDDAYEIAKYDQATDDDPATGPLTGGYLDRASVKRRRLYHFPNADRMAELRRAAERCPRGGRLSARDFKAVGWYLHAFEDVYAHKSHGPWLGHLVTWHTQDRPWTKPGDFLAMFEAKYQALLALRQRCGRDPKPGAAPNSDYKRAGA